MKDKKVGPGSPPRAGQFRKGESGNWNGRPKAQPKASPSVFTGLFEEPLRVMRNGIEQAMSAEEAIQVSIYRAAIEGKKSARQQVLRWIIEREKARAKANKRKQNQSGTLRFPKVPDNANDALLLLGIASLDTSWGDSELRQRLLLEPWGVQQALSRRHGGQVLTNDEIAEIKRCTRDGKLLRFPRV